MGDGVMGGHATSIRRADGRFVGWGPTVPIQSSDVRHRHTPPRRFAPRARAGRTGFVTNLSIRDEPRDLGKRRFVTNVAIRGTNLGIRDESAR
ncbi:MAG: hypothetical protein J0I18_08935, partial [Actinobacteria bacterium]|nr:hypothetical protein [Actinomycetota bacterium]